MFVGLVFLRGFRGTFSVSATSMVSFRCLPTGPLLSIEQQDRHQSVKKLFPTVFDESIANRILLKKHLARQIPLSQMNERFLLRSRLEKINQCQS